jgi:hypothetical protein
MNIRTTRLAFVVASSVAATATLAQEVAEDTFPFEAYLSGAQEVVPPDAPTTPSPGVVTPATGAFRMAVDEDLSSATFQLTATIVGATQAHLHCGRAGENGPVVVPLMQPSEGTDLNGTPMEAKITNAELVASAEGCTAAIGRPVRNVASLVAAAFEGLIYANVHTVTNPAGEIRGQLVPGGDDTVEPPPTPPPSGRGR